MKVLSPLKLIFLTIFILAVGVVLTSSVLAQEAPDCGAERPIIDFACQRQRLFAPDSDAAGCDILVCPGGEAEFEVTNSINLNFFGVRINARSGALLQTLLFVLFNVFLGVVTITLGFYGIYGSFLRARAESEEDVSKSAKILRNAVVGLFIIAGSFVLVQLLASFLGLGSINEIVDFTELTLQSGEN